MNISKNTIYILELSEEELNDVWHAINYYRTNVYNRQSYTDFAKILKNIER